MEQCDFMNPDFELIEHTDLDDEDLYKAVDVILAQSQSTETPENHEHSAANVALSTEPVHFEEPPLNPSRFVSHTPIDEFLQQQQNANTKRKTQGDMKLFQSYLASQNEARLPLIIPPSQLSGYISGFLLSVRKKDGDEFEPVTLRSFFSSINRHLITNGYKFSIMTDIQFRQCRDILAAKSKQLKSMGKGNKPKAADEISDENIDTMYEKQVLGLSTPRSITYSMWLICTLQFGMRTGKETYDLCWGDIELKQDDDGSEYIVYTQERQTKTRTGSNPRDVRKTKPRAYAVPEEPDRDPVALYKKFRSVRPVETLNPDSPFFLSINYSHKPDKPWFKKTPMGINKIYSIMNDMKAGAGLETSDKRLTPYSVRKHLIQKLTDEGLPPDQIIQISGQKNVNSLNNYRHLKAGQTKAISSILSNRPQVQKPALSETVSSCPNLNEMPVQPVVTRDLSAMESVKKGCHVPTPLSCGPYHGGFDASGYMGMFSGNQIHGNININFNQSHSHSQQLSKTQFSNTNTTCLSPGSPKRKWKRIRLIDSDSE